MYGSRIRRENRRQPVGAGSACRSLPQPESQRVDRKVRIRELQCMVPEFVVRTGGSKWQSALPTGNADQRFLGESRKTEDLGRSNLWRPTVVDRMRGSKWLSALPTGVFRASPGKPKTLAAPIYGGQWSSPEPAAASGCRPCRPPLKGEVSAKRTEGFAALVGQRIRFLDHEESGGFDLWPTDSLGRREQLAPGTARSSPEPAAASGCRLSLPGKGGLCDGLA